MPVISYTDQITRQNLMPVTAAQGDPISCCMHNNDRAGPLSPNPLMAERYLMTEVDACDKLLEEPQGSGLWQACTLVCSLMPVNVICQVSPRCILTHNGQVLWGQEDFPELNDVGMVKAQPLVQHLSGCNLHTAARKALV